MQCTPFYSHFTVVLYKCAALTTNTVQVIIFSCGLCGRLKLFHCRCFVQAMSVTSSWWSVLMLMSQQLAALILLALPAFISPPPSSSSFKAAATATAAASACHTHFNTPDSFDRLYWLISHFPKPSMFIQHLGDHSTAPFCIPSLRRPQKTYTHPYFLFLLAPPVCFITTLLHYVSLPSSPLSGLPFLQWLGPGWGGGGVVSCEARQRGTHKYILSI